jgi:murein DD-endopeptidase MepM/ murein hydrolase activator NlpD
MTLSMSQGINVNSSSSIASITGTTNMSTSGTDFSAILQMLLSTSMSSISDSESGNSLQNLLLSLAPYLQNLSSASASFVRAPVGLPVQGGLTQEYHAAHQGLDFGIEVGTNVKSTMAGVVKFAGWNDQGYGNLVIVDNGTYQTYYGHLSSVPVEVGDTVAAGQVIGVSGNTGNSTGPHLHYEVRVDGKQINPTSYVYGKVAQYRV